MKPIPFYTLDVFTDTLFGGNPLAVIPDAPNLSDDTMQKIANEFNLSETVFCSPKNADGSFDMRIFTPAQELPTAGHPTIGTAYLLHHLFQPTKVQNGEITLNQKVGPITVEYSFEGSELTEAAMYQVLPEFLEIYEDRKIMSELLSISGENLMEFPIQKVSCGVPYVIIPVKSLESVREIKFRLDLWETVKEMVGNAFIYAFTPSGERAGSNLHGRMFAPEAGLLEDPATGSANGPLGCYATKYNIIQGPFVSEQGFEMGRPSIMKIDIGVENGIINKVRVGGQAQLVSKGELFPLK